jgi:hypothetical protein
VKDCYREKLWEDLPASIFSHGGEWRLQIRSNARNWNVLSLIALDSGVNGAT